MRIPTLASASLILAPALGLALLAGQGSWGQQAKTEPAPARAAEKPGSTPPASIPPELEEEITRTREDLESLQLWLNAKRAQLKAAESSSQVEHRIQGEYDRMLKKGITSSIRRDVSDVEFLEADSQRTLIIAEINDLQVRYNRTRRYLNRLEQYGTSAMKPVEDHVLELTELRTRLQYAERMISKLQEELKDTKTDLEAHTRLRQHSPQSR
jgi:hypothetical protein